MRPQYVTTPHRLVHNTIFNVLALVSGALTGFFLIRFFLGQLGENRYGLWVLVGSVFQYRRLLDMGMNSSINRYIPVHLARGDDQMIQRVLSTSLMFFCVLAVVLALISGVIYLRIGTWFTLSQDMVGTAGLLVLIVGASFALAMPLQLASALLSGLQRYDVLNLTELLMLLVRTVLVVLLLQRGYGLLAMGLVFGVSEVVVRIVQFVLARALLPRVAITLKAIDLSLLREMLAYGVNTFAYTMGAMLIFKATDVVIAVFLGTAEVSQFAVAIAGVLLLSQLLRAFTAAIKPAVSDLDARDEHPRVREISFLMQKYSLLVIIPAVCFLTVMGKEFLQVWVGEKFQAAETLARMSLVLAILAVGHGLRLAQHSNFVVLVGKGDHRVFGLLTVGTAALCIGASVVALSLFDGGLIAIAWSNSVPMAVISGLVLPIYFNWKMQIPVRESLVRIWWPAMLGCLPTVILISIWKYLAPPMSWLSITTVVGSSVILTSISAWYLSLRRLERQWLATILWRPVRRLRPSIQALAGAVLERTRA